MNWRKFLLPFSVIYWLITSLRNLLYNIGILPSKKFNTPVICVGNLSMGGTGKSPHVIHIVELLSDQFELATLSRGYGRKTSGFRVVNYESKAYDVGDEPLQFFNRFKNKIVIAVGENRVRAIKELIQNFKTQVVVLDDGFQHRKLKPGFVVLLTDATKPYFKDYVLPVGNLREPRRAAKRANIIVVTKCPDNFSVKDKNNFLKKINPTQKQQVYFSKINYAQTLFGKDYNLEINEWLNYNVLLVTGIAKSNELLTFSKNNFASVKHLEFGDHHNFTESDVKRIQTEFSLLDSNKIILTTEKDYMRLQDESSLIDKLFYLPIYIDLEDRESFNKTILDYAKKNTTSR